VQPLPHDAARQSGRPVHGAAGGDAGDRGDSVGTYICADLGCHENVRLAAPLAPSEVRASVDRRIDGTRHRVEAFVERVVAPV
jgi:hypothetical protein